MPDPISFAEKKAEREARAHHSPGRTLAQGQGDAGDETEPSATVYVEAMDGSELLSFPIGGGNVLVPGDPVERAEVISALETALGYMRGGR